MFSAIIHQELGFFDKNRYVHCNYQILILMVIVHSIGELTNRLSADTQVIQSAVTENLSLLARYTMQMLISIGLMFYISARLTAVLLSVLPIIVISAVQYGKLSVWQRFSLIYLLVGPGRFLKGLRKDFQDKLAHASSTADESFGNIMTVRSFSNEGKMVSQYSQDINGSYKLGRKLALLTGLFIGTVSMFMYVSLMQSYQYVMRVMPG